MTAPVALHPRRRRSNAAAFACLIGLAALWLLAASRVHVNTSWSDDAWGYLLLPLGTPELGDAVLFEPPRTLGTRVPYLKTVRGLPGATISIAADRTVFVDGIALGRAKTHALDGRPLEAVPPGKIPPGHYYLHGDHVDSHDSRYAEIGLVPRERILGRALAFPDLPWLGLDGPPVGPAGAESGTGRQDGPDREPARGHPRHLRRRRARAVPGRGGGSAAMRRAASIPLRALAAASLALALSCPAPASAKDLGVRGATWAIAEPDLLAEIENRLAVLRDTGALARFEEEAKARARSRIEAPRARRRHRARAGAAYPAVRPGGHGRARYRHPPRGS